MHYRVDKPRAFGDFSSDAANKNIENKPWIIKVRYDIRDVAMINILNAMASNHTKKRITTISLFISNKIRYYVI